ncbi:hypothetical protein WICPIJ_004370 [Wickerhamomyces pijperi]|uniref:Uncharacterized protein n=1 Tax=Wickerhamomyces pijperi TaxID=599730 RepID=A0A9P8Q845_WICPI|nr:hypothetical protein WICPIJ_004370 [Wickerhamomyces pijperi]
MSPSSLSLTNSPIATTSFKPANLAKWTPASVCPLLALNKPSLALNGTMWPGLRNSTGFASGLERAFNVKALSCAEIPVVVPSLTSKVIV